MFWVFTLFSCAPIFTADLSGYVLDSDTYAGIPGVELKFFESEPANFADDSYVYQTSTDPSGLFQQPLIWDEYLPKYWTNGDVISMYFSVVHPDYKSKIEQSVGIVSNVSNVVPTTLLTSLKARVENLRGSVYSEIEPINGVQIAIYDADDTAESPEPLSRTTSTNIDGLDGQFVFESIEWNDIDLSGDINVIIRVEDQNYINPIPSEIAITLFRSDVPAILEEFIVEPIRPEIFTTNILGSLGYLIESEFGTYTDEPIIGAEIRFDWYYDDENQSVPTFDIARSDSEGNYSVTIRWEDDVADNSNGVPFGEDQLEVEVSFPTGGTAQRPFNLSQYNDTFVIRSWIDNTLPAAYEISIYEPPE